MSIDNNKKANQPVDDSHLQQRMIFFSAQLSAYTSRRMTNDNDSLNAFRGVLSALGRHLFPQGFVHGLPLRSHAFSLGWMHSRHARPKRRPQFPSWSWTGWQGTVVYPEKLVDTADGKCPSTTVIDLELQYLGSEGNYIDVEGWCVDIDIRTEPLSELLIPGQDQSIGTVKEGDSWHNNTLQTGRYHCLVIQRQTEKIRSWKTRKETTFLLALDKASQGTRRQALLVVTLFSKERFDQVKREKKFLRLV